MCCSFKRTPTYVNTSGKFSARCVYVKVHVISVGKMTNRRVVRRKGRSCDCTITGKENPWFQPMLCDKRSLDIPSIKKAMIIDKFTS